MKELIVDNLKECDTLSLILDEYTISVGDRFIVNDILYTTLFTSEKSNSIFLFNITSNNVYNIGFDTIYDLLTTMFRHCIVKVIDYKENKIDDEMKINKIIAALYNNISKERRELNIMNPKDIYEFIKKHDKEEKIKLLSKIIDLVIDIQNS